MTPAQNAATLPQPSEWATKLALTATPDTFPHDSYGLALWLDQALARAGGDGWRHVKRGTVYHVIGNASLQIATCDLVDGSDLVIYRGEDGKLWAREDGEFHDGRFIRVAAPDAEGRHE